jgi:hypothetical protein
MDENDSKRKHGSAIDQVLAFVNFQGDWVTLNQVTAGLTNLAAEGYAIAWALNWLTKRHKLLRRGTRGRYQYKKNTSGYAIPKFEARDILAHEAKRIDVSRMTVHEAKALYLQLKEIFDA